MDITVPTFFALSCIQHYTSVNGIYFVLEYCGVEPKTETVPTSQAPFIHSSTSAFIGLGPVCIPDQASFVVWVEPVLLFTLVRKLDCEWFVVCMSWKHLVRPLFRMGSCSIY